MLNPTERWEQGIPHDPRSEKLMRSLKGLDWEFLSGHFDFRTGGDGDDGETLMYLMDIHFEREDARKKANELALHPERIPGGSRCPGDVHNLHCGFPKCIRPDGNCGNYPPEVEDGGTS
jgi:hypothetical protein